MKTVTLDVRAPSEAMADFVRVWKTRKAEKSARISFATPELLWKVLTAKRWELLKAMCGAGPISIREAARRVERDVKAVHGDITALLNAGVLSTSESILYPAELKEAAKPVYDYAKGQWPDIYDLLMTQLAQ